MKFKTTLLFLITVVVVSTAQTKINSDSLQKEIRLHFKIYPPESERYSDFEPKETKASFAKEQIEAELHLFEVIKKSDLLSHPTMDVLDLCHNITILVKCATGGSGTALSFLYANHFCRRIRRTTHAKKLKLD
jgi:hypothetical protein